ncbi:MAG: hypothetical protein MK078_00585 [Crocinitomicaceae bacterium]|nr:hypothetical protein [Crocinitomicaceae bacterium]
MNNNYVKYSLLFLLLVILQGFVINHISINTYINPMIYPVLILLLPYEINFFVMMLICLLLGFSVDALSNTFGLHAAATIVVGYTRPIVLRYIKPRDGYDNNMLPTLHDMGLLWSMLYCSILLAIHHLWFFIMEVFRLDLFGLILGKVFFSLIFTLVLVILFQYIFFKSSRK